MSALPESHNFYVEIPVTIWPESQLLLTTAEILTGVTNTDTCCVRVFFRKEQDARAFTQILYKEMNSLLAVHKVCGLEDIC